MPLSPKKVYKKPWVDGACTYCFERDQALLNSVITDNKASKAGSEGVEEVEKAIAGEDGVSGLNDVAIWPFFDKGATVTASGSSSGDGNGQSNQKEKSGKNKSGQAQSSPGACDEDIIKSAEELAEEILAAKTEKALQESYAKGKAKAEKEYRSRLQQAAGRVEEAEKTLQQARGKSARIIASSESKIVELAVAVAERLVCRQLELKPETITGIVRETMKILDGKEQVEVYVNPAELENCLEQRELLKDEFKEIIRLEVYAEEDLPRGSCRVESESGVAEYVVEDEKDRLQKMLLDIARAENLDENEKRG